MNEQEDFCCPFIHDGVSWLHAKSYPDYVVQCDENLKHSEYAYLFPPNEPLAPGLYKVYKVPTTPPPVAAEALGDWGSGEIGIPLPRTGPTGAFWSMIDSIRGIDLVQTLVLKIHKYPTSADRLSRLNSWSIDVSDMEGAPVCDTSFAKIVKKVEELVSKGARTVEVGCYLKSKKRRRLVFDILQHSKK